MVFYFIAYFCSIGTEVIYIESFILNYITEGGLIILSWEKILMDAGMAAVVVGIISVISGIFKILFDLKKGTEKLQYEHTELKSGQGSVKESILNVVNEMKLNNKAINNVDKMLTESKVNQRRDFESLSKDQKELKEHMDKFQSLLHDWEKQANIIKELEYVKQQLTEKNNSLERKIDKIHEETKRLKKENAKLKEKINAAHDGLSRSSLKDIAERIQKTKDENSIDTTKTNDKGKDRER